jgi:hypothetical protein
MKSPPPVPYLLRAWYHPSKTPWMKKKCPPRWFNNFYPFFFFFWVTYWILYNFVKENSKKKKKKSKQIFLRKIELHTLGIVGKPNWWVGSNPSFQKGLKVVSLSTYLIILSLWVVAFEEELTRTICQHNNWSWTYTSGLGLVLQQQQCPLHESKVWSKVKRQKSRSDTTFALIIWFLHIKK